MKKTVRKAAALLLIAGLCAGLAACGPTASETPGAVLEPVAAEGIVTLEELGDYQIVCSSQSPAVQSAAKALQQQISYVARKTPEIVGDSAAETETEIIIGTTARAENQYQPALRTKDYSIRVSGRKILLFGGSDDALAEAVYAFMDSKLDWMKPEFEYASASTEFHYDYLYTDVTVGGKSVAESGVAFPAELSTAAKNCVRKLEEACGVTVPLSEEGAVVLRTDGSLEPRSYSVFVEDGKLVVAGVDAYAVVRGYRDLFGGKGGQADENGVLALAEDYHLTGTYAENEDNLYRYTYTNTDPDEVYIHCTTGKSFISYAVGEEIVMRATCFRDGAPVRHTYFSWTTKQAGSIYQNGLEYGEEGWIEFSTTLDQASFMVAQVSVTDAVGNTVDSIPVYDAGAAADIDKIGPAMEEPADFDAFWDAQRAKLAQVEPLVLSSVEVEAPEGYVAYDVRIQTIGEKPCSGIITMPRDAEPGSLKLKMEYNGYGYKPASVHAVEGTIVFHINNHGTENIDSQEYYDQLETELNGFGLTGNADPEQSYFYFMLMRDAQGIRYAKTLPEWNGRDIETNGGSMGGFQSVAAAFLDPDVTYVNISAPWMADQGFAALKRIESNLHPVFEEGVLYFDPIYMAGRITCELMLHSGTADGACPATGVAALYNNFAGDKTVVWSQHNSHGLTYPAQDSQRLSQKSK